MAHPHPEIPKVPPGLKHLPASRMLFTITKLSALSRYSDSGARWRKHDRASEKRRETAESSRGMLFLWKLCF